MAGVPGHDLDALWVQIKGFGQDLREDGLVALPGGRRPGVENDFPGIVHADDGPLVGTESGSLDVEADAHAHAPALFRVPRLARAPLAVSEILIGRGL